MDLAMEEERVRALSMYEEREVRALFACRSYRRCVSYFPLLSCEKKRNVKPALQSSAVRSRCVYLLQLAGGSAGLPSVRRVVLTHVF